MARQKQAPRKSTGGKAPRTAMPPSYNSEDEAEATHRPAKIEEEPPARGDGQERRSEAKAGRM